MTLRPTTQWHRYKASRNSQQNKKYSICEALSGVAEKSGAEYQFSVRMVNSLLDCVADLLTKVDVPKL